MVILSLKFGLGWKTIKYLFAQISLCSLLRNMENVWAGKQAELVCWFLGVSFVFFLSRIGFNKEGKKMAMQRENWHLLALVTGSQLH